MVVAWLILCSLGALCGRRSGWGMIGGPTCANANAPGSHVPFTLHEEITSRGERVYLSVPLCKTVGNPAACPGRDSRLARRVDTEVPQREQGLGRDSVLMQARQPAGA